MEVTCSVTSADNLPIKKFRNEILYLIESTAVVIVVGPTGSGKTTQIPKFLLEQGWSGIACTQPRRLSAIAMANRVSQELGWEGGKLGGLIGYSVRFEEVVSERTICRFITDGMLFRECLHDPLLSKYSVIIIDEAHERSLHTDLLLALIKKILPKRPDLRIIISSATIDSEAFKKYFTFELKDEDNTTTTSNTLTKSTLSTTLSNTSEFIPVQRFKPQIISIEGKCFPVEVNFLLSAPSDRMIKSDEIIIDAVVRLIKEINLGGESGDILVFLSGRNEIEKCYEKLVGNTETRDVDALSMFKSKKRVKTTTTGTTLEVLQLYAGLSYADQLKVFEPTRMGSRKVILSTNIAEASVTIDGIVHVIDSGRMKVKFYTGNGDKMVTIPISKASADQRAGRAGRTRPGKVYRLYSEEFYNDQMLRNSIPDLQLVRLTPIILQLKAMRIDNFNDFDFLSPLPNRNIQAALEELKLLKALNPISDALTDPFGKQMARLPLEPELAHFLLKAVQFSCSKEAAALAAMLTIQSNQSDLNTFFIASDSHLKLQRRFWVEEGDHLTLLNIFMSYLANSEVSVKFCHKYALNLKNLTTVHRLYSTLLTYLRKVFNLSIERDKKMTVEEISINLRKSLISAYPLNVAKSDELRASYTSITSTGSILNIHPNSVLFKRLPPLILYGESIETTKKFIKPVTVIEAEWLEEIHPNLYKQTRRK